MKPQPAEELLSAYLDGAATPDERRDVEAWLEESPEARRTLNDFGRLSTALRSLPRREAPPEFAAQVMQSIERTMLLPAQAASSPAARRSHSRWLTVAAPVVTLAAMLAFAFVFVPRANLPRSDEFAAGAPSPTVANEMAAADAEEAAAAMAQRERQEIMPAAAGAAGADEGKSMLGAPPRSSRSDPPSAAKPPAVADAAEDLAALSPPVQLGFTREDVGRVRRIIQRDATGQKIGVIHLYVVDESRGLLAVQQALTENLVPARGEPSDLTAEGSKQERPSSDGRNMAILVQATEQQIEETFLALVRKNADNETVDSMLVDEPIALAEMDESVRHLVESYAGAANATESPAFGTDPVAGGKSAPSRAVARIDRARMKNDAPADRPKPVELPVDPDPEARVVADASPAARKAGEAAARPGHTVVSWPLDANDDRAGARSAVAQAKESTRAGLQARVADPTPADRVRNEPSAQPPETASVQVVIVIHQAEAPAKKAAPPRKAAPAKGSS
jgi:hypothetical protein